MTDPVDTDALREAYRVQSKIAAYLLFGGQAVESEETQLRANLMYLAAEEIDRLRTVIENAPHGADCHAQSHGGDRYGNGGDSRYCICWKTDAL